MSHDTLANYYRTLWAMTYHHKYSIDELENLIPFELDLLVEMTSDYIQEQEAKNKALNG